MAPIISHDGAEGFLELDLPTRDSVETLPSFPQSDLSAREPVPAREWPQASTPTLDRRDSAQANPSWNPSLGTRPPESFNNKGYFALFALLGAAMVVGAVWFFFWAENGGFRWRRGDWDDYKSTVLRRKDKNGKTLSNATPSTDLGQKSVAGTFDYEKRDPEMGEINEHEHRRQHRHKRSRRPHGERGNSDEDMRAYRNEKSAKVGGLNREHDGSHYDFTNSDYSYSAYSMSNADDAVSNNSRTHLQPKPAPAPEPEPAKKKGFLEKKKEQRNQKRADKKVEKDHKRVEKAARKEVKKGLGKTDQCPTQKGTPEPTRVRPAQRRPSLSTLDVASTVADSAEHSRGSNENSYYANYRPEQPTFARTYGNRSTPRRHSPRPSQPSVSSEAHRSSPLKREYVPQPPGSFDAYSEAGSSDTGTKVYQHHIPGANRSAGTPSRSNGYRRGGRSRRDSLSDSE